MPPPNQNGININEVIQAAQMMLDNGQQLAAELLLKNNGIKARVEGKRIVDDSDMCQIELDKFVTINAAMVSLKDDVRKLAEVGDPVLITGPTGTGKELIAKALHGRRSGPFKAANCAGFPLELAESILFGHVQGAFTGAVREYPGLMKLADDGTFFLDEVSELPLAIQAKLLRAIQAKKITKVGGRDDVTINCRIVCASNRSLSEMCDKGTFRLDLYARIGTFELNTLDLNERPDDIPVIYKALGADPVLLNHILANGPKHPFNVRSIEQNIKRYNILRRLP